MGMQHLGIVAYAEGGIVDGLTIATQFLSLRAQLKITLTSAQERYDREIIRIGLQF